MHIDPTDSGRPESAVTQTACVFEPGFISSVSWLVRGGSCVRRSRRLAPPPAMGAATTCMHHLLLGVVLASGILLVAGDVQMTAKARALYLEGRSLAVKRSQASMGPGHLASAIFTKKVRAAAGLAMHVCCPIHAVWVLEHTLSYLTIPVLLFITSLFSPSLQNLLFSPLHLSRAPPTYPFSANMQNCMPKMEFCGCLIST